MAQPFNPGEALRLLALLGKDTATTWFRNLTPKRGPNLHRGGPDLNGFDASQLAAESAAGANLYLITGNASTASGISAKTGLATHCVIDDDITSCPALFVEWDAMAIAEQVIAWQALGLPEPTAQVLTGGKSVHSYWALRHPIPPSAWWAITQRLIAHCRSDRACSNPSRLMRLPGAPYYDKKSGQATGRAELIHESTARYSLAEIEAAIPQQTIPPAAATTPPPRSARSDFPPRPPEALRDALAQLPPFTHGAGQYEQLVGLAIRLHVELGATEAQQLLAATCCQAITDLPAYFKAKPTRISPGSIWAYLRDEWAIDISRTDLGDGDPLDGFEVIPDGFDVKATAASSRAPDPQAPPRSPLLSLAEVRTRLADAVAQGASRLDLEALRLELAAASDHNPASLVGLQRSIEQEHEAGHAIAAEVRTLQEAHEQRAVAAGLTLEYLLPPSLAQALRVRTRWLPADDVAALMTYLVTLSGVVKLGTEIVASYAADYRVPLNLYGALVARSGAKKSPLSKLLVSKPTHELRLDLARQHTRAMTDWTEQNRGVKPSERPDPPKAVYLSVSDATAEALAQQLQVQEGRGMGLLLHRDELAGLFGSLNQYRSGRGSDSEQLLEAYDGSGFRSLRVAATGGGRFYDRCHLSIWGTIQPAVLRALVADGDASGLWARFLFIPLPEVVVPMVEDETTEQRQAADQAADLLAAISHSIYRLPRTTLELSAAGRRAFMNYEARCQHDALAATLPAQGALFGKAPGKALRLAALLHLVHQAAADGQPDAAIGPDAIARATTLTDHLNAWTLSLHADAAAGGANDLMRLIHRIATNANGPIGWRDIATRLSKAQRQQVDSAAATKAMQALVELGAGEIELTSRGTPSFRALGSLGASAG